MRHERDRSEKARVFDSQEARDRWQIAEYGHVRNGFRTDEEPRDDRPLLVRAAFWDNESERLTYEHAVETNPCRDGEGAGSYIIRVAETVLERRSRAAAKQMPRPMSRRQRDEQLAKLRAQAREIEATEDRLKELRRQAKEIEAAAVETVAEEV